jgi:hypothetical protein
MHDHIAKKTIEIRLWGRYETWRFMGSISSSLNPGVANLLQTLTSENSPVMNSQNAVNALKSAPVSDIVQLSEEATQLQGVDALFGISPPSTSSLNNTDTLFGLPTTTNSSTNTVLQALESAGATVSASDQEANDQAAAQASLAQGLFGVGTNNSLGGLLNTVG